MIRKYGKLIVALILFTLLGGIISIMVQQYLAEREYRSVNDGKIVAQITSVYRLGAWLFFEGKVANYTKEEIHNVVLLTYIVANNQVSISSGTFPRSTIKKGRKVKFATVGSLPRGSEMIGSDQIRYKVDPKIIVMQ